MIVKKEFLQQLKDDFRLNIYEVKIWTALLSRGIATAGELADISGVPRSRCYDVLESLEKKSFIIMKIGKPIKYIAIQPEEIVERVRHNLQDEATFQENLISQIKETEVFKEIELLHKAGIDHIDATQLSNSLTGRDNVQHFMRTFIEKARQEVIIVTTAEGYMRKISLLKNTLAALRKKGVSITIYAPVDKTAVKKMSSIADVRSHKTNLRYITVDNKELLFMLSDDTVNPAYDSGIWVKSPYFTKALQTMFADASK